MNALGRIVGGDVSRALDADAGFLVVRVAEFLQGFVEDLLQGLPPEAEHVERVGFRSLGCPEPAAFWEPQAAPHGLHGADVGAHGAEGGDHVDVGDVPTLGQLVDVDHHPHRAVQRLHANQARDRAFVLAALRVDNEDLVFAKPAVFA